MGATIFPQLALLGIEAFTRWLAQHQANEGLDHGQLIDAALADYSEADKVRLEILMAANPNSLASDRTLAVVVEEMKRLIAQAETSNKPALT